MLRSLGIPSVRVNALSITNHPNVYYQNIISGTDYCFLNFEQNEGMFEIGISNEKMPSSSWSWASLRGIFLMVVVGGSPHLWSLPTLEIHPQLF